VGHRDLERADGARRDPERAFLDGFSLTVEDANRELPRPYVRVADLVRIPDRIDVDPRALTDAEPDRAEPYFVFGVLDRERALSEHEQRYREQRDDRNGLQT